jgi:hypothetical protein
MSHHNSGPRAHALPIADITDMYAFPAPDQPGRLVLVLCTLPYADPAGFFSDALIYRFRLRPVTVATGKAALFSVAADRDEVTIDCTFSSPVKPGREFVAAIRDGREPSASVASVLDCCRVLGRLTRTTAAGFLAVLSVALAPSLRGMFAEAPNSPRAGRLANSDRQFWNS